MAFGAVATGSINAQLADSAAGNISIIGSIPDPIAVAANIGISKAVVAVLLVISVRKVTHIEVMKTIRIIENLVTPDKLSPIAKLIPVVSKDFAIASPPAKSNKTPH